MKCVFPLWDMDTVIRSAGAERVSEDASKRLDAVLSEQAGEILKSAKLYAMHAGRRHITRHDIVLAAMHKRRK